MKIRKMRKFISIVLLGVALFAVGCAAQPAPSQPPPTTKPPSTPPPASAVKPSTLPPTISSTPAAPSPIPVTKSATPSSLPSPTPIAAPPSSTSRPMAWSKPPEMQIDKNKQYTAALNTSLGTFKIKLLAQESPLTVNNFVFLSRQGFYNGVIFHRIIKTFMIQTGDPTGTGMGSPGYKFADELPPKHKYDTGIVAMANSGANTNGSQFFICTGADARNLDNMPNYTQFGQVSEGMDIVQKIASVPVGRSPSGENSKPVTPPVINSITITEE